MTTMIIALPPELWIRIALSAGQDTDEHVFNSLARAVSRLGRWTMGARDGDYDVSAIINRRLDLMLMFGYSVLLESRTTDGEAGSESRGYKYGCISWIKNGIKHRNDQPAVSSTLNDDHSVNTDRRCNSTWYYHGQLHRVDGPAINSLGLWFTWYRHGALHRTDGPARMFDTSMICWQQEGKDYRTDGPATICVHGDVYWCPNGVRHRTDGPAVIHVDGTCKFYLHGERSLFVG